MSAGLCRLADVSWAGHSGRAGVVYGEIKRVEGTRYGELYGSMIVLVIQHKWRSGNVWRAGVGRYGVGEGAGYGER